MDLYHYTYLNANGYLDKFRVALNMPELNRAFLTKILNIFDRKCRMKDFIIKDDNGYRALYNKEILNKILGIDSTGYQEVKPKYNANLQYLEAIIENEERKEIEKENPTKIIDEPSNYVSDEEDMEKVSQQLIDYQNVAENKCGKKIYVTEEQFRKLVNLINEDINGEFAVDPEKVMIVKKFLDDNFMKGGMSCMGEDGYPMTYPMVTMKGTDGQGIKNMSDKQLYALLLDKFGKIYGNTKQVRKFLQRVMKDWYYDKISKEGMLSTNRY